MNTFFESFLRYWHTLRHLKLKQILGQIRLRINFPLTRVDLSSVNELRITKGQWTDPCKKPQSLFKDNEFKFLNKSHKISEKKDWNDDVLSKLWLYNLHYFDDLNGYDSDLRKNWHVNYIGSWIRENEPGFGAGWEPYPVSLRIVNWIKWCLSNNTSKEQTLLSLNIQARYLIKNLENHLLGNHLFANAKALIFSGLYFKGDEPDTWFKLGIDILIRELEEQVGQDGGHFELSTMYHSIFLEDLLDIVNLLNTFKKPLPQNLLKKIKLMHTWLEAMTHPDGDISFFNDSALGIASRISSINSYMDRLNIKYSTSKQNLLILDTSGYARVNKRNAVAIIDMAKVGPDYLPGHAHADSLSFELSLFCNRFIVNSGTSTYEDTPLRNYQRGTSSHSTLEIDSKNSSQIWGSFRVAKRAKIIHQENYQNEEEIILSASHDGYVGLKGNPIHSREWKFTSKGLDISDIVSGQDCHSLKLIYHLHPKIKVLKEGADTICLLSTGEEVNINVNDFSSLDLTESKYYPEFGKETNNYTLIYTFYDYLPKTILTSISW